jgi:hypothetical protein
MPFLERPLHRNRPDGSFTIQNAGCPVQVESERLPSAAEINSRIIGTAPIVILTVVFLFRHFDELW